MRKLASLLLAGGALWGAAFRGEEFAFYVGGGVLGQRNAGIAALLRAVVHQAVFADVEVARAGAAAPVVRLARGDCRLEVIEARVVHFFPAAHLRVNLGFVWLERL